MPDNGDYIADYLSGGLSPEEMKEFEARLTTDEDLNKEFQLLSKGMEYLKARAMLEEIEKDPDLPRVEAEERAHYKERIRASSKKDGNISRDEKKFRKALLRVIPAAVMVGVILLIRSFLSADPASRLYNKYYEPVSAEIIGTEVVRGPTEASLQSGIECYLAKDYSCAISQLKELPSGSFYLGVSYLGLEQYEEALEPLLAFQEEYPEHPLVNWYLGLTYLRLDQPDVAISHLERLSSIGNPYHIKAEKLIRKIGKIEAASQGVQ